jgi:glucan 1,3-beta-glucosidase
LFSGTFRFLFKLGKRLGGWLSIEPWITPSLFAVYPFTDRVIDEWTLSQKLGPSAASTIEQHYTTFIQEDDISENAAAGLDHVRIQFSYWAVTTYSGDPYMEKISWRYLLRASTDCASTSIFTEFQAARTVGTTVDARGLWAG